VFFFSVSVFKKPKLIDRGLFPLSDSPLPSALPPPPPGIGPYGSTGGADDMPRIVFDIN
jgi:hypothetical protein